MSAIDLTSSQQTILMTLVNLYSETDTTVKGETIAGEVDRNPGTIRNQMQSLKALQLVEGVPGPRGGYRPTARAYDVLDIQQVDDPATVPVRQDGDPLAEVNVVSIELSSVHHPQRCRAEIHLRGPLSAIEPDTPLRVGPTPLSKLTITGTVDGIDESSSTVVLRIEEMRAPSRDPQ